MGNKQQYELIPSVDINEAVKPQTFALSQDFGSTYSHRSEYVITEKLEDIKQTELSTTFVSGHYFTILHNLYEKNEIPLIANYLAQFVGKYVSVTYRKAEHRLFDVNYWRPFNITMARVKSCAVEVKSIDHSLSDRSRVVVLWSEGKSEVMLMRDNPNFGKLCAILEDCDISPIYLNIDFVDQVGRRDERHSVLLGCRQASIEDVTFSFKLYVVTIITQGKEFEVVAKHNGSLTQKRYLVSGRLSEKIIPGKEYQVEFKTIDYTWRRVLKATVV